ncbi:hypothetical protein HYT01_00770 [Candidatus Giovannonibacteria bacterium]|nr:hypothetical protein [Candidatus Giovannonibacteria bacterium]
MNKKAAIALGAVIILVAGYYVYLTYSSKPIPAPALETVVVQNAGSSVNDKPLENAPDLNPVNKANPFKSVKTNPFE